jgi:hypothetical protein
MLTDNSMRPAIMSFFYQMDADELERFSLGQASVEEMERFEEHMLICENCRERFEESERYVLAMRAASAELCREEVNKQSQRSWPRLLPMLACAALLTIVVAAVVRFNANPGPLLAVQLTAIRGTAPGGTAPAGRGLALTPDLIGIATPGPYRLEIVDERGAAKWQGAYDPAAGPVKVPAQRAGAHFVRIYSNSGELLREYGLDVRR